MGPLAKFKQQFLENLFRGLNTLWQVWTVLIADPIDIFNVSAWEGLLAALMAAGLAAGRQFVMDMMTALKELTSKIGTAVLGLFR